MAAVKQDVEDRGNWTGKLDFILSAIGYSVGLGNVWRFPYLAYRNGGASFLFPYIIMLAIAGIPLFFIEVAVGQFSSQGPLTAWNMAPVFAGIGYAMVIISALVSIYYNMIITYALYYMMVAFVNLDDHLPWERCGQWWNTDHCRRDPMPNLDSPEYNDTQRMELLWGDLYDKTCVRQLLNASAYDDFNSTSHSSQNFQNFLRGFRDLFNNTSPGLDTLTHPEVTGYTGFKACAFVYTSSSQEYYDRYILRNHLSDDIGDLGGISLKLIMTLLLAWIIVFACLKQGIKTSGKVVYFTATFPYVILIVLLVRGVTLEGHIEGIKFYVIPEWSRLLDPKIWGGAATQIFYSMGIGFGGLLTMASYNKFSNNCYRDAILVGCLDCATAIFSGFAIFSMLGHMAHTSNKKVEDVATSGPGLAFVAYPEGISQLPASPVWAFLFFFMLLTLGLDSQFGMYETVISGISDVFPKYLRKHKTTFTLVMCLIGFLLGIPQCTHGGILVLTLLNDYSGSYNLMFVALSEIVCLCYVYGIKNFCSDIEMMVGSKPSWYWVVMWVVVTPVVILFLIIINAVQYTPSGYDGKQFPDWAEGLGWVMVTFPLAVGLVVAVVQVYRLGWQDSIRPTSDWGPALEVNRTGRYATDVTGSLHVSNGDLSFDLLEKKLDAEGITAFDNLGLELDEINHRF
ncbi:LOW QUALITY PROTEIN: sodium-dependent proline transporter-like [Physella acuta]|uniref:LOW QUALITY PROTEIN: sodium-dependent proline transporter-like n=1 Tax=Physella acuta TaxID=109671 RepID=UPI0027DD3D20|nr:LOW QUALITY PROTEIN: sodium-dependent proline transporter-like [Physella acuta]